MNNKNKIKESGIIFIKKIVFGKNLEFFVNNLFIFVVFKINIMF